MESCDGWLREICEIIGQSFLRKFLIELGALKEKDFTAASGAIGPDERYVGELNGFEKSLWTLYSSYKKEWEKLDSEADREWDRQNREQQCAHRDPSQEDLENLEKVRRRRDEAWLKSQTVNNLLNLSLLNRGIDGIYKIKEGFKIAKRKT